MKKKGGLREKIEKYIIIGFCRYFWVRCFIVGGMVVLNIYVVL